MRKGREKGGKPLGKLWTTANDKFGPFPIDSSLDLIIPIKLFLNLLCGEIANEEKIQSGDLSNGPKRLRKQKQNQQINANDFLKFEKSDEIFLKSEKNVDEYLVSGIWTI